MRHFHLNMKYAREIRNECANCHSFIMVENQFEIKCDRTSA